MVSVWGWPFLVGKPECKKGDAEQLGAILGRPSHGLSHFGSLCSIRFSHQRASRDPESKK